MGLVLQDSVFGLPSDFGPRISVLPSALLTPETGECVEVPVPVGDVEGVAGEGGGGDDGKAEVVGPEEGALAPVEDVEPAIAGPEEDGRLGDGGLRGDAGGKGVQDP